MNPKDAVEQRHSDLGDFAPPEAELSAEEEGIPGKPMSDMDPPVGEKPDEPT